MSVGVLGDRVRFMVNMVHFGFRSLRYRCRGLFGGWGLFACWNSLEQVLVERIRPASSQAGPVHCGGERAGEQKWGVSCLRHRSQLRNVLLLPRSSSKSRLSWNGEQSEQDSRTYMEEDERLHQSSVIFQDVSIYSPQGSTNPLGPVLDHTSPSPRTMVTTIFLAMYLTTRSQPTMKQSMATTSLGGAGGA